MKLKLITTFILYFFIFSLHLSSQTVTFKKKNPQINDEKYYLYSMDMKIDITAYQNEIPIANFSRISKKNENKKIKILNIADNKIIKIELTYEISEEIDKEAEIESKKVEVISGKTYYIENINKELKVSYKDGTIPKDEEIQYILNDSDNKLNEESYLENLTLKVGDRTSELENVLKNEFLSPLNIDKDSTEVSAVLKKIVKKENEKCALFEIKINTNAQVENVLIKMNLSGEFIINTATSIPVLLKISGPIYMNGKTETDGQTIIMKGAGILEADLNVNKIK